MAFRVRKKPSLTGHSHTHRPNTCQEIKKHTRATSRHPSAQGVIWICCWPRTASRCVTSVFPLFLSADQKGSALTRNPSSRGNLAGNTKFRRSILSRRHVANTRNTREPPTCSQCGARGSNTVKNTPRSTAVQKKRVFNTSSMSLAQIKWKHRRPTFDTSLNHVRTSSTCVKSATRARCTVPAALLIAVDGGCAPAVKHRVR